MSRLFITEREINFISDITKELIKDVVGQKVYYYPISETKTKTHELYGESLEKVFDNPIILDALVDNNYQTDTKISSFGVDSTFKIEVFVQYRDLIEKGIQLSIGDYFSFSNIFYEVSEHIVMRNIYGLPEHKCAVKIVGTKAREGQFKANVLGATDISHTDTNAVQKEFEQQRGYLENNEGVTGDRRELLESNVLEKSIGGQRQISEKGAISDNSHYASSFYDEE